MATAPQVQTLAQIMADLSPTTNAQNSAIDANTGQLKTQGAATVAGLQSQRGQAWNDIGTSANARGLAFSGIPADEQSRYDSTQFMPAVANVGQEIIKGTNANNLQKSQLEADNIKYGLGRVDQQQSSLNQWNLAQMQNEAQAKEGALNRAASARESAASRAASTPKTLSPNDAALGVINGIISSGADINSSAFQLARDAYKTAGGNTSQFASDFWKYVPQSANTDNSNSGWRSYYYG